MRSRLKEVRVPVLLYFSWMYFLFLFCLLFVSIYSCSLSPMHLLHILCYVLHCIDWYLISCTFTTYHCYILQCIDWYFISCTFTTYHCYILQCIDWYLISCTFTTYHCYVLHCIDWYFISCTFTPYPLLCFTMYWLVFYLLYIYSISFAIFYNVLIGILSPVHLLRIVAIFYNVLIDILSPVHLLRILCYVLHCIDWYFISCTFTTYPLLYFTMYWLIFNLLYIYYVSLLYFTMYWLVFYLLYIYYVSLLYFTMYWLIFYLLYIYYVSLLYFTMYWLIFYLLYIYYISFAMFYNVLIDILSPVHLLRILCYVLHCIDWYFISCTFTTYHCYILQCIDWYFISCTFTTYPLLCFTLYWLIFYLLYIYSISFAMFYTVLIDI